MSLDEDELIERTLWHLRAHQRAPGHSDWAPLLAAIMEGFERGWVEEAHLTRNNNFTHLHWMPTARGERALSAYQDRLSRYPVVDETQDGGA